MSEGAGAPGIVVIGVGNPHRRDDGIGPALARRLAARLPRHFRHAVERGDDIARLIAAWDGADTAYVIDAALSSEPPGTLTIHDGAAPSESAAPRDPSSHGSGIGEAIALSRALGSLPRTLRVISVVGADFGHGESLSPALAARLDDLTEAIATTLLDAAPAP